MVLFIAAVGSDGRKKGYNASGGLKKEDSWVCYIKKVSSPDRRHPLIRYTGYTTTSRLERKAKNKKWNKKDGTRKAPSNSSMTGRRETEFI